jgi:hypothetical protein
MENPLLITVLLSFLALCGCSGPSRNSADSLAKAAALDAYAGVPYAGAISLGAAAVDILTRTGKPRLTKLSPGLSKILRKAPRLVMDESFTRIVKWLPSAYVEGGRRFRVTFEETPQKILDYQLLHTVAGNRYRSGDFGDGGKDAVRKNREAWLCGKRVVAEYSGPNGLKVIVVSDNNMPGEMMLPEEWEERDARLSLPAGKTGPPGVQEKKGNPL